MEHAIASNYLGILEKCLRQCGVDNFLKSVGFDNAHVNDASAYLNLEEFNYVLEQAYSQSNCPHLGLLFGEHLSIVNHGFLGYAAMTSPTMGAAIQTVLSFLNTRTNLLRGQLHSVKSDKTFVEFNLLVKDALINRFITEMAIMHLTKMRIFLINATTPCLRIEVAYAKPSYVDEYQQHLHTPVIFNTGITRVWLLTRELDSPVNFADDASYQQAKIQVQSIVHQLTEQDMLPQRIKKILYNKELYQISMEQIARELCVSPRTMRRHLQQYHTTYQEILDEVRQQKAKEFLINSSLSVTEISFLLGFHGVSNFSKVFKRWTNLTPTDYRDTSSPRNL